MLQNRLVHFQNISRSLFYPFKNNFRQDFEGTAARRKKAGLLNELSVFRFKSLIFLRILIILVLLIWFNKGQLVNILDKLLYDRVENNF